MRASFYGCYFKCQSRTRTLAVIPAIHKTGGKRTCSIQVITDNDAGTAVFDADVFHRTKRTIFIGENKFGAAGIQLAVRTPELTIKGKLDFGPLLPLKYDIMGPFALVLFMECRHSVWSMIGVVLYQGREYRLATYLGAKAVWIQNRMVRIVQGNLELEARLLEAKEHPLKAPANGDRASFEYEYPF